MPGPALWGGVEGAPLRRRIRFGDRGPRRGVLVEDLPPLGVDLVDLVALSRQRARSDGGDHGFSARRGPLPPPEDDHPAHPFGATADDRPTAVTVQTLSKPLA